MTAIADRASRLRLALTSLLAEHQRRLDELLPLRELVKGSVYQLQTRCGKPSCHCASDQGPLHASPVLSWSEHGKTRLRTLPAGERARFQQLTESYRRPSRPRGGANPDGPRRLPVRPFLCSGRLVPRRG